MRSSTARSTPVAMCGSTPTGLRRLGRLDRRRRLGPRLVEGDLQLALEVGQRLLGLLERDVAALDERLDVQLAHAAVLGDRLVHQRLRVARVVALVVAVAAVAQHVDDDVLVEPLAVLERQPGHADAGLRVVAVDVEDRRLHRLGDVAAVDRRAGELGRRREADLVVDDQVDRAADPVAGDVAHRQRLGDDALAGEGGVAVDAGAAAPGTSPAGRSGPGAARTMPITIGSTVSRWLGLAASSRRMSAPDGLTYLPRRAEVVLDVAGALHRRRVDVALELAEDRVVALAHDVGQHVEPAAVGHADDGRVEPGVGGRGEDLVEDRDRRLGALEAEPLRADVLRGEELLERLGGVEALEDAVLGVLVERRTGRPRPWSGSSAAPRCPGCACTRRRSCGSTRRAARRAGRRAASSRCRRRHR